MAMPTETGRKGLRYADLAGFPDDLMRREIIDGELIVTAAPTTRHQRAVANIVGALLTYQKQHSGQVFPSPTDVFLSDENVVEPDVLFVAGEHVERVEDKYLTGAPDLVVEISSPSTRRLELVRKRDLYARFGVPEYWYIDLDAERVEAYRLEEGGYAAPTLFYSGQSTASWAVPGFSIPVDEMLGG